MKLLLSVESLTEARVVVEAGCTVLDVKNTAEGSLGAAPPWVLNEILSGLPDLTCETSAAVGDLEHKPATAALASYAAATFGLDYVKVGLHGSTDREQATAMMKAVKRGTELASPRTKAVAGGYSDWRRFSGLAASDLLAAAADAKADVVLLDTAIKDGSTLFDNMSIEELQDFVGRAHEMGLLCALAGRLQEDHLDVLAQLRPDFIGVRSALCSDPVDRRSSIDPDRTQRFVAATERAIERASVGSSGPSE